MFFITRNGRLFMFTLTCLSAFVECCFGLGLITAKIVAINVTNDVLPLNVQNATLV